LNYTTLHASVSYLSYFGFKQYYSFWLLIEST
jgi:hypothetical protein